MHFKFSGSWIIGVWSDGKYQCSRKKNKLQGKLFGPFLYRSHCEKKMMAEKARMTREFTNLNSYQMPIYYTSFWQLTMSLPKLLVLSPSRGLKSDSVQLNYLFLSISEMEINCCSCCYLSPSIIHYIWLQGGVAQYPNIFHIVRIV